MAAIDYQNINPANIKLLSEKELKATYSGLRSILRKRIERMAKKGIESPYPMPVPTKEVPADLLRSEVAELASQLRDPGTRMSGGRKLSPQTKAIRTLQAKGYNIRRGQLASFAKFMELVHDRMKNIYEVKPVINAYIELRRQGVSIEIIKEKFADFVESEKQLEKLVQAAQNAKVNYDVMSAANIKVELDKIR